MALAHAAISDIHDLITLSDADIDTLGYPSANDSTTIALSLIHCDQLRSLHEFHMHHIAQCNPIGDNRLDHCHPR